MLYNHAKTLTQEVKKPNKDPSLSTHDANNDHEEGMTHTHEHTSTDTHTPTYRPAYHADGHMSLALKELP